MTMHTTSQIARAACALLALTASIGFAADSDSPASSAAKPPAVRQIDWEELLPPNERDSTGGNEPAPIHDYLGGGMAAAQMGSFEVNPALNGATVKLPGFVVPLEMSADGTVKEFFLVPYFGACIHVPPPPPNQIVYVKLTQGAKVGSIYDAQWVVGQLRGETKSSRFGAAAYTLDATRIEPYKY